MLTTTVFESNVPIWSHTRHKGLAYVHASRLGGNFQLWPPKDYLAPRYVFNEQCLVRFVPKTVHWHIWFSGVLFAFSAQKQGFLTWHSNLPNTPKTQKYAQFPGQSVNLPVSRWKRSAKWPNTSIFGSKKRSVHLERQFAKSYLFHAPTPPRSLPADTLRDLCAPLPPPLLLE